MSDLKTLLTEITALTNTIETDHPELYTFLDEQPITIPAFKHPNMNKKIMKEYLDDLKQVLNHYIKSHKDKK
ncbi:hypothetical protein ADIWIN_1147 [Winogradskyella psychrotolerans RS-3]|uniref:Uncharacterized protein n=1 Tax=Winogradskyella psychrotolerans RS-3 TaxID=641526 RepID=S7VWN3_9FLAO|nr:hypothetical protein [Winogradskyella psychrotolerans]EPR73787.1 hypothetical protein ADIWIN_1147 [Winogradskyella psychrotolerans RS-3]